MAQAMGMESPDLRVWWAVLSVRLPVVLWARSTAVPWSVEESVRWRHLLRDRVQGLLVCLGSPASECPEPERPEKWEFLGQPVGWCRLHLPPSPQWSRSRNPRCPYPRYLYLRSHLAWPGPFRWIQPS